MPPRLATGFLTVIAIIALSILRGQSALAQHASQGCDAACQYDESMARAAAAGDFKPKPKPKPKPKKHPHEADGD